MKCRNCGGSLKGSMCLNCGTTNDYDYSIEEDSMKKINEKRMNFNFDKKFRIISISILLILFVGGSYFIFKSPKQGTAIVINTSSNLLEKDFKSNKLSANDYVLYTTYLIYDNSKLPKKYKTNQFEFAPDISYLYTNYYDQLDSSTREYVLSKINLDFIELGPDTSNEEKTSYLPLVDKAEASGYEEAIKLDKAIPSTLGNVLVWYTTTGQSAITDELAKDISNDIDKVINDLTNEYGVTYKFKHQISSTKESSNKQKLKAMGIDESFYDKLNVYIYNDQENSTIAGAYIYSPCDKAMQCNIAMTTDVLVPYLMLNTKYLDDKDMTRIIYTHELYHEFQHNIYTNGNFNTGFIYPDKTTNDEFFTTETTANLAAAKLNPNFYYNKLQGGHLGTSIINAEESIHKINGYATYRFLYDYEKNIENGKAIVRDSIKNPNRIQYLYDNAKGKFDDVLAIYGYNMFLNNYNYSALKYKQLIDDKETNYTLNPVRESCVNSTCNPIKPASINNYKINLKDYKNTDYLKIKSNDISGMNVQFVGVKEKNSILVNYSDKKVTAFEYDFINKSSAMALNKDEYITEKLENYKDCDAIIIIISNGDIINSGNYTITINGTLEGNTSDKPTSTDNDNNEQSTSSVATNIYYGDKLLNLESFNYNWRTYVNLNDFCKEVKCNIINNKKDKNKFVVNKLYESIDSDSKNAVKGVYDVTFYTNRSTYNSKVNFTGIADDYFDLIQQDIIDKPCPTEKDEHGVLPKYTCDDDNIYVPIRFIMQGLGYLVDYEQTDSEYKVLLKDNVKELFDDKYRFVLSKKKVDIDEEVDDPIEFKSSSKITLDNKKEYYVYVVDNDNIRKFKSSFAFLQPASKKNLSKGQYFEKKKSGSDYIIKTSSTLGNYEQIILVANYEIEPDDNREFQTTNVSYPISVLVKIKVGE